VRGLRRCRRSDQLTRPYDGRGLGAARQQTVVPDPVPRGPILVTPAAVGNSPCRSTRRLCALFRPLGTTRARWNSQLRPCNGHFWLAQCPEIAFSRVSATTSKMQAMRSL
jgi:hypothetical protein